jgi:hypothetical protein
MIVTKKTCRSKPAATCNYRINGSAFIIDSEATLYKEVTESNCYTLFNSAL